MTLGIDFDGASEVSASAIKSAGYTFVARYLGNSLTSTVVGLYEGVGLQIVSLYESICDYYVNGAYNPNSTTYYDPNTDRTGYVNNILTYGDGYYQAIRAYNYAKSLNQPDNSAIYFAVDVGIWSSTANVVNYFEGINAGLASVNSHYKVGIYGDGPALNAVDSSLVTYKWWAYAWSSYGTPTSYVLSQTDNSSSSDGFSRSVDHDTAYSSDYGQWGAASHVAPTVNVQNVSVAENASILASSMITSVSNPSGDSIADYEFYDGGTGGGYFTVNGAAQSSGQWFSVTTANLGTVKYVGGSSTGSETLYVAVYDGTTSAWSAYSSLTATTTAPHVAPTVLDDFNGDGRSDILWRNTNGDAYLWNSTNSGGFTGQDLGVVDANWQIAGVSDFNGDGKSDILWRNTNGHAYLWNSTNSGGFTGQDLGVVDASWQIANVSDFNGDGKSDILWRASCKIATASRIFRLNDQQF